MITRTRPGLGAGLLLPGAVVAASAILTVAAAADHQPEPANACATYLRAVAIATTAQDQWETHPDSEAAMIAYARAQEDRRAARINVIATLTEHGDQPIPELLAQLEKARNASEVAMGTSLLWLSLTGMAEEGDGRASTELLVVNAALDAVWEAEHTMIVLVCDQSARMHG